MSTLLDAIDHKILDLLQRDARMTNAALAAQVGLKAPSVFERIRKMEQRGVIQGYTIRVDPTALGKPMTAFIRITTAFDKRYDSGVKAIREDPEILECYNVAGEDCFILKTRCGSPGELEGLLARIRSRITVLSSVTMIALSAVKENGPIRASTSSRESSRRGSSLPGKRR